MEQKEYIRLNELPEDPRRELRRSRAGNALFDKKLKAYKRLFLEDEEMDDSYKILLLSLLANEEQLDPTQTKQKGKEIANELLLSPPTKGQRSESRMKKLKENYHLIEHDGVRKNARMVSRKRPMPGEKQKGKHHFIKHEGVRENSGRALGKIFELHKRKYEGCLIALDDVRENAGKALEKRFEPHKKQRCKGHLISHEDVVRKSAGKALEEKLGQSKKRKNKEHYLIEHGDVCENMRNALNERLDPHKQKDEDRSERVRENAGEENGPGYELFLKHLKDLGMSYAVEYNKDSLNVVIKYDNYIGSRKDCEPEPRRKPSRIIKRNLGFLNQVPKVEKPRGNYQKDNAVKSSRTVRKSFNEHENVEIEKLSPIELRNFLGKPNEDEKAEIGKCTTRKYPSTIMKKRWDEAEKAEIGKCWAREFRNVRGAHKSSMPRKNINGDNSEDESEYSDVEIIDMNAACLNGTFVSAKRFSKNWEENGSRLSDSSDEFRGQVLEVLTKPFDKDEYLVLKKEFEARCYTDYHPDLGRKLNKWRYNRRKRLAILRGFFFWLQNLTREGAFKPWTDGVCLAVEPQSPETTEPDNRL